MRDLISVFVIGVIITIGKILIGNDQLNWRLLLGRGILGGAIGLISYPAMWIISSWIPVPGPLELQIIIGLACAFSAMGTEIIEKALKAVVFKFTGKDLSEDKQ